MLWYQAFDCQGDVEDVLAKVEERITVCKLGRGVPRLCVQQVDSRKFLLYLGLESAQIGWFPRNVEEQLLSLYALRSRHAPCRPEEVDPIYEDWKKRTDGRVVYRPPSVVDFAEDTLDDQSASAEEASDRYDRLLLYLSARGEGSWETFCRICTAMWPFPEEGLPAQVLRRLKLLGHVAVQP